MASARFDTAFLRPRIPVVPFVPVSEGASPLHALEASSSSDENDKEEVHYEELFEKEAVLSRAVLKSSASLDSSTPASKSVDVVPSSPKGMVSPHSQPVTKVRLKALADKSSLLKDSLADASLNAAVNASMNRKKFFRKPRRVSPFSTPRRSSRSDRLKRFVKLKMSSSPTHSPAPAFVTSPSASKSSKPHMKPLEPAATLPKSWPPKSSPSHARTLSRRRFLGFRNKVFSSAPPTCAVMSHTCLSVRLIQRV